METKNFKRSEIECKCGCGKTIEDEVFMFSLQRLRAMYGKPMLIGSGFRCPDYNDRISKTGRTGPHTIAAVDVIVSGHDAYRLLWMAMANGFTGIGVAQRGARVSRFLHLDRLQGDLRPWVWSY